MTRVATVQTDGVERYGLLVPCVVGSTENLRAVLIYNVEDAAYIVEERIISNRTYVFVLRTSFLDIVSWLLLHA